MLAGQGSNSAAGRSMRMLGRMTRHLGRRRLRHLQLHCLLASERLPHSAPLF